MTIETPDIIMGDYRVGLVQTLDASALLSLYESGVIDLHQDRDGPSLLSTDPIWWSLRIWVNASWAWSVRFR